MYVSHTYIHRCDRQQSPYINYLLLHLPKAKNILHFQVISQNYSFRGLSCYICMYKLTKEGVG